MFKSALNSDYATLIIIYYFNNILTEVPTFVLFSIIILGYL